MLENNQDNKQEVLIEETVENKEKDYSKPVYIESEEALFNNIETRQKAFSEFFNGNKKTSTIILVVFVVLMVAAVFLLGKLEGVFLPVIVGLIVVYFVILFIFSNKSKTQLNENADRLIDEFFLDLDSYVTQNEAFSDLTFDSHRKLDEEEIKKVRLVKDINHVGGRDVIRGKIFDNDFSAGDVLIKTLETDEEGTSKHYIVFLGKMFIIEKSLTSEGRAIIYLKGKGANGPTDIDDLQKVEGLLSEKYDVYSSFDLTNIVNSKVKDILEQFENNEMLLDMFISIDTERVEFGFSYSDAVMRVPLVEELNRESITQYKQDVERMIAILAAIK